MDFFHTTHLILPWLYTCFYCFINLEQFQQKYELHHRQNQLFFIDSKIWCWLPLFVRDIALPVRGLFNDVFRPMDQEVSRRVSRDSIYWHQSYTFSHSQNAIGWEILAHLSIIFEFPKWPRSM